MPVPVLHVVVGPNGAGKTTYYEAARLAADHREEFVRQRRSFVTETIFSRPSKVDLIRPGRRARFDSDR